MPTRIANEKPALTGIRGVAAIGIFFTHSSLPSAIAQSHPLISKIKEVGWIGVPLFFALSGYLITWLALVERASYGTLDLPRFYKRRVLRIFPLYFAVSLALIGAWFLPRTHGFAASPHVLVPVITFTVNIALVMGLTGVALGPLIPLWTVAAEEQFYFCWGITLRYATRRNIGVVALSALGISLIVRLLPLHYFNALAYRSHPGVSIGSMMAGCLLALYHDKIRAIVGERDLSIPAILGVIAIAFIGWPNPEHIVQAALVVSAVDVLVVVIVFEGARPSLLSRALSVSWLKHAGDLSYALYLTHYAIIVMYARVEARTPALLNVRTLHPYFALALALTVTGLVTFAVAEVLTLFEAPFRRMRHELRHSRRNDPGLAPAYSPLSAPPSSISLSGSA